MKQPNTVIKNNTFTGVHWDATVVASIQTVAEGLKKNAEGLLTLAELFKSQNVESIINIRQNEKI